MELDRTRISVRERNLLDTCDLALHVCRQYGPSILVTFFAGAIPFVVINDLLVGWIVDTGSQESFYYADDAGMIARFVWETALLVSVSSPFASALATAYLGQAMFVDHPQFGQVCRGVLSMAPRLMWCHLIVRGLLPLWLLFLAVDRFSEFDPGIEFVGVGAIAGYAWVIRLWRPFINEIVLLERSPLTGSGRGVLTIGRRSGQLHGPSSGDLLFRGLLTYAIAICLTLALFGTFVFVSGVFLNDWRPGPVMIRYVLPLSMWITAAYLSVVRFLSYLDLRIRQEGWEVELRLRAEGERLTNRLV